MKPITYLLSAILGLCACLFLTTCEPAEQPPKEQLKLRMYNADIAQAELLSLSKLDPAKLSQEDLAEKKTRETDLPLVIDNMKTTGSPYWGISEAQTGRVPPGPGPTPCPIVFGCTDRVEDLSLFELGIYIEIDSLGTARLSATPQPTATLQLDPDHIFAIGKITAPADPVFKTARLHFTAVDGQLATKDLTLLITTSILKDGKLVPVELKLPIPANTFSTD